MPPYFKRKALTAVAAVLCAGAILILLRPGTEISWEVLFPGLPAKISVSNASHNAILYILKQTHEPLLRRDDGQNYSSRVLKSWSRSLDGRLFIFCPDTELRFNEASVFDADCFFNYVSEVSRKYSSDAEVSRNGIYCHIKFKDPQEGFLEYLALYENAPSIKRTEQFNIFRHSDSPEQ